MRYASGDSTPIGMNGGTVAVVLVCVLVGLVLGWLASRVALGRRGVLRNAYGNFTEAAPSNAPPGGWQPVDPHALASPVPQAGSGSPADPAAPQAAPSGAGALTLADDAVGAAADRDGLAEVCLSVADRLRESDLRLWKYLHQQLERLDIRPVMPDGEPFDAEAHDAVGFELTPDAKRHLTVASTERAGYTGRGRTLRRPEVIVFREAAPSGAGPDAPSGGAPGPQAPRIPDAEGTAGDAV